MEQLWRGNQGFKKAADAVVRLRVNMGNGRFASGTGFMIMCPGTLRQDDSFTEFIVMTNSHVIQVG